MSRSGPFQPEYGDGSTLSRCSKTKTAGRLLVSPGGLLSARLLLAGQDLAQRDRERREDLVRRTVEQVRSEPPGTPQVEPAVALVQQGVPPLVQDRTKNLVLRLGPEAGNGQHAARVDADVVHVRRREGSVAERVVGLGAEQHELFILDQRNGRARVVVADPPVGGR